MVRRSRFASFLIALLICGISAYAWGERHEFRFSTPSAKAVSVAGTFNNWNKDSNPMSRGLDGKTWSLVLDLEPGEYQYKFVVDGGTWTLDPTAPSQSDGNGNSNSILWLLPTDYGSPARIGDGIIARSALKHEPAVPDLNFDHGRLQFSLRARPGDIAQVLLHVEGAPDQPMVEVGADRLYARYRTEVPWNRKRVVTYDFKLVDGPTQLFFGPKGVSDSPDGNLYRLDPRTFKPFEVPGWVEKSVIYQIFPDRFANGDPGNDPPGTVPWNGTLTYSTWLGGDLKGVQDHLGYLQALGISCIYFNPVFQSPVYHRYETSDYHLIARELGTNQQFDALTKELRARGIRTVLDGVFNHTATDFAPFADVVKHGAASPYRDWYTFKGFPVKLGAAHNYVAWDDYPSMPKLHHANPEVQAYLWGVPKFWADQAAIGGWRLDAANEVPDEFWRGFRRSVKSLDPNEWIVGEVWGDASHWLRGDMWDSVMNYPFLFATTGFLGTDGDGKPSTFMSRLMANYALYAPQVSRNMMNLIDSHDTPRILNACGGDRALADMAAVLEFAWVGAPTVYYGDELGMAGGKDPDNRRGMTWEADTPDNPTLGLYRRLIAAREHSPELESGSPVSMLAEDATKILAFARVLNGKFALCVANRSNTSEKVTLDLSRVGAGSETLYDAVTGQQLLFGPNRSLRLTLPGKTAKIFIPEAPARGSRGSLP